MTQNSLNDSQERKKIFQIEKITLTDFSSQGLIAVDENFVLY